MGYIKPNIDAIFMSIPLGTHICGVRLLGVGRLTLSMEKVARVDVGLDDAQPNLCATLRKGSEGSAPFGAGVTLAEVEHEQKRELNECTQLLVAQLKLDCQCEHGSSLVYAGRPANWLRVGFGGYEEPSAVSGGILSHLTARLPPRRGLPRAGMCSTPGRLAPNSIMHNV